MLFRHLCPLILALLVLAHAAIPLAASSTSADSTSDATGAAGLVFRDDGPDEPRAADLVYPDAPDNARRPTFVRQSGKNCAFASAAMLLDKWTGGRVRPSQPRLRGASGVPATVGVSFGELARAVERVTRIDLRYSPGGGDPLTWERLISRLARGGGAIVGGSYSRLPRHYQRWSSSFAALGARGSGHAVYVERYQPGPGGGRVWLMDPLAYSAGYRGEWIAARALRAFAWRNANGLVTAAATPEPPPLAGYDFGTPELEAWPVAGREVSIRLPFTAEPGWAPPRGLTAEVEWQLISPDEPEADDSTGTENTAVPRSDPAADLAPPLSFSGESEGGNAADEPADSKPARNRPRDRTTDKPSVVRLSAKGSGLIGTLDAPSAPGTYSVEVVLRRRDGNPFPEKHSVPLMPTRAQLLGPLAAEVSAITVGAPAVQGSDVGVEVTLANRGGLDWAGTERPEIVATWDSSLGTLAGGSARVELASGDEATVTLQVDVPTDVSEATLTISIYSARRAPLATFAADPLEVWVGFDQSTSDAALSGPRK